MGGKQVSGSPVDVWHTMRNMKGGKREKGEASGGGDLKEEVTHKSEVPAYNWARTESL